MNRDRWNAQDVAATVETHDVERLIPGQVDEVERSPTTGGQKIVFLVRMEIELPGPAVGIIGWTGGRATVDHQIAGIGGVHRNVEKTHRWCVAEAFVGQQFKHLQGRDKAQALTWLYWGYPSKTVTMATVQPPR